MPERGFLLIVFILAGQAQAADKTPTLEYSAPEELKGAAVTDFSFRTYKPADMLYVASHNTNLRKKPRVESGVVATLPMATRVKVLGAASGPSSVIGKVDRWYRVEAQDGAAKGKTGFLFGMVLTPAAFHVDLDSDGEKEIVTAAFAQNFKIRIRIREPKVDQPDHTSVDVDAAGGAFIGRQGGLAGISLVSAEKAGVALVAIDAHVEASADFAVDPRSHPIRELTSFSIPEVVSNYDSQSRSNDALVLKT